MNLYKNWWKYLAVLILLYTVIAGLMVPLKPGITSIGKSVFATGEEATISVEVYNAKYGGQAPKSYIKLDQSNYIEAKSVEVGEGRTVNVTFDIPATLPGKDKTAITTLFLTDEANGTLVYPNALILQSKPTTSSRTWDINEMPRLYKKSGFLFPYRNILIETIRNTFYHIPLWFSMFILFFAAMIMNIKYLQKKNIDDDHKASSLITAGILMGCLGLVTGSIWAKNTWGAYWTTDVKLNMSAISMMIYFAYVILRSSMDDVDKRARISSAYSIFAFFTIVPLIFVIPRITDSLHPGNGGNPAFGGEDMDNTMRMVFYPAIIGFTLLGTWIASLVLRIKRLNEKVHLKMME